MAHINVYDFTGIGLDFANHTATSYKIAKDEDLEQIIDESIYNTENKIIWHSKLPKRPEDGEGYYGDMEGLYAAVRIHMGNLNSPWMKLRVTNQKKQEYVVTENGEKDKFYNSDELGITEGEWK